MDFVQRFERVLSSEIPGDIVVGNCLDVMREMPGGCVDLVVTDPPYGIGADKGVGGFGISKTDRHYSDSWDNTRPCREAFTEILRIGKKTIIFGGNFFADLLPLGTHWIVWDKKGEIKFQNPYSDCELLWTNIKKNTVKKYTFIQQGFITDSQDKRCHPTQKPSELLEILLRDYSGPGNLIFDPFMGSGTTAVAADRLGRRWFGCDISKEYVEMSLNRISQDRLKRSQLSLEGT